MCNVFINFYEAVNMETVLHLQWCNRAKFFVLYLCGTFSFHILRDNIGRTYAQCCIEWRGGEGHGQK